MAAFSSSYLYVLPPDVVEATALKKALKLCHNLGLRDVILEGNCLKVIDAMNSKLPTLDAFSPIIHDIHHLLLEDQTWTVFYIPRSFNKDANLLARLACTNPYDFVWIEDYLSYIETIVQTEKLCITVL